VAWVPIRVVVRVATNPTKQFEKRRAQASLE
jgi:hypothetical protein